MSMMTINGAIGWPRCSWNWHHVMSGFLGKQSSRRTPRTVHLTWLLQPCTLYRVILCLWAFKWIFYHWDYFERSCFCRLHYMQWTVLWKKNLCVTLDNRKVELVDATLFLRVPRDWNSELDIDWIHPWIGLDWIGSAKMDLCPTLWKLCR